MTMAKVLLTFSLVTFAWIFFAPITWETPGSSRGICSPWGILIPSC